MKIIGRISKNGKMYYQTAVNEEGKEPIFIPVFIKKSLEGKFNFISSENKIDKRGIVYTLFEIEDKNIFFPEYTEEKDRKAIITK